MAAARRVAIYCTRINKRASKQAYLKRRHQRWRRRENAKHQRTDGTPATHGGMAWRHSVAAKSGGMAYQRKWRQRRIIVAATKRAASVA